MKYSFYATEDTLCEFDCITEWITEVRNVNGLSVAKISFNDNNYNAFLEAVNSQIQIKNLIVYGDDKYLYSIDFYTGCEKLQKFDLSDKKIIKNFVSYAIKLQKNISYSEKISASFCPNAINKIGVGMLGYNKYIFVSERYNRVVPFRFRKAKDNNQLLVIYFGGGGTLGYDNFKPLFEHITIGKGSQLIKTDCNILVPQVVRGKYLCEETAREIYIEACYELLCELIENFNIDKNRIYICGCSFGGGLVWNMLVNHSDIIAGAVELMGCYFGYKKISDIDFESMSKVPIWMVHSIDDNCVKIDSDDRFYNELKRYNAKVKYTRFEKYGHKAAEKFSKQNNWTDWLLSQQK